VADELTPRQVAESLGVTPRTVQRWIASGRLAATRVGGRQRVSRSSLAAVAGRGAETAALEPQGSRAIRSLLIANRGEVVARVVGTARRLGIRTVGVHAPDDLPPRTVDLAIPVSSYLDGEEMISAALRSGADAVHPGYGFLAEDPAFAEGVARAGLTWVGPPAAAMEAMADKAAARQRAAALGVPVVPGYDGDEQDQATLASVAEQIGYPLLVKPRAGGGGKGIQLVTGPEGLDRALDTARREAGRAFGDDRLMLERYLAGPRHIEIQVLLDTYGNGIHLGERDCSAQRRNQKIVEESPAPSVSPALRDRMGAAALTLASNVAYEGAGTVEFLVVGDEEFFFLEMNTRLQVEHPVTEAVTGRDLVAHQLAVAEGRRLALGQGEVRISGHAIEARLYAEDPAAGFLPATGRIVSLHWPAGPGIRVDSAIAQGDAVTDRYDPMLAKIIAFGETRAAALARLQAALDDTRVLGVRTNLRFLRWLMRQDVVAAGEVRTDTVSSLPAAADASPNEEMLRAAARQLLVEGPYGQGIWGGGWRANAPAAVWIQVGDEERRIELAASPEGGASPEISIQGGIAYVDVGGQSEEVRLAMPASVEEAVRHAAAAEGSASLVAPMPGRVIAVRAVEGQEVDERAALIVIEAMKMEHAVATPIGGRVARVLVREGQQVQRGDLLVEVSA
jgi:acetyl-CoA/propionyl-CoA carboxylase, biotin carboxylase, biotin carboxyl carrier protein